MGRISTYVTDTEINDEDRLLGSEAASNVTKNYSVLSLGEYFRDAGIIGGGVQLVYKFQQNALEFSDGEFMLSTSGGVGVAMSDITGITINKTELSGFDIEALLRQMFDSNIAIYGAERKNTFGEYTTGAVVENSNSLTVALTSIASNGSLVNTDRYYISKIPAATASWGNITGDITNQQDLIDYIADFFNNPPAYSVSKLVASHVGNTLAGTDLIRVTCSDEDGHTPVVLNLTSYNTTYFTVSSTQDNIYVISAAQDVPVGTYTFTGTVSDSRNLSVNFSYTYVVLTKPVDIYVYGHTIGANDPNSTETLARERLGSLNGDAVVTSVVSGSILEQFVAGNIGQSTITVTAGTATLARTGGLRDLKDLEDLGAVDFSSGNRMLVILFPNSSDLSNKPLAMYDSSLPNPNQQPNTYALYANSSIPGTTATGLIGFSTSVAVDGYTEWIGIVAETGSSGNYPYSYYADEETP